MNINSNISLLSLAVFLSSCAIFAPDERDDLNRDIPEQFSLYSEEDVDKNNRWWENFQSQELNALIEDALTNSPSIQQSWARLAQADAVAAKVGADRFPSVGYSGSTRATRFQNVDATARSTSFGLPASYEVDLWGRVKSSTEAAQLDYEASRETLNTAAITLSSRVTMSWLGIIAQKLQLGVIELQLELNKTALELIELRFRRALSSALDVYQQRQTVAGSESLIPLRELIIELQRSELGVLLGQADFKSVKVLQQQLPELGPLPAIGIPADMLANRPDVRQAGLRLQAADWSVSAARADRLPSIRLTGSLDYSSTDFSDLFDDWSANLAASLTGPIFDGGRRKAEVARTRAVVDERLAAYRETVLNAMKEVEDALVSESKQHTYIEKLDARLAAGQRSYEEAVNRYRNGLIEYATVLRELNIRQGIERERVVAQFDLLRYRVDLYRALGGTWPNELKPVKNNKSESTKSDSSTLRPSTT